MGDKIINQAPKKLVPAVMVILAILVIATGWTLSTRLNDQKIDQLAATTQPNEPEAGSKVQVATTLTYSGEEGKNALELLKATADVVTQDSSYGEYVDSINGIKGGEDGKYWAFYINGEMAQVGANAYQTKNSDRIEWKFE